MIRCGIILLGIVLHLGVSRGQVFPDNIGGGDTGSGNNIHIDGTPDTPKLSFEMHCLKNSDTNTKTIDFVIRENDPGFKFSDVGPKSGEPVEFEACYFIDVATSTEDNVVKATYDAAICGDSVDFTYSADDKMFRNSISGDVDAVLCGGQLDVGSGQNVYGVYCKRKVNFDKQFDVWFEIENTPGDCIFSIQQFTFKPLDVPRVVVRSKYDVTLVATDDDGNEITATLLLGHTIRLLATLALPDPVQPEGGHKMFFDKTFGPIGIYLKDCYAEDPDTGETAQLSADGCGLGAHPARTWSSTVFVPEYIAGADNEIYVSPNQFRTKPFEGVSFARDTFSNTATVKYNCDVEYCFSDTDTNCFGSDTGYPVCPRDMPSGDFRKKRSSNITVSSYDGLPNRISTTVTFKPAPAGEADETCSEQIELISVTSFISVLFMIFLVVASLMVYHIQSLSYDVRAVEYGHHLDGMKNAGFQHHESARSYKSGHAYY